MTCQLLFSYGLSFFLFLRADPAGGERPAPPVVPYADRAFWQETHEALPVGKNPDDNQVRSIAVDGQAAVWIATAGGVFRKPVGQTSWSEVPTADKGPAYAVETDAQSTVWLGTWNGLYRYRAARLEKVPGPAAPISVLCAAAEGVYALGPNGVWLVTDQGCQKKDYAIARSVRDAVSDGQGGLWVASDVGVYHCTAAGVRQLQEKKDLLSAYARGLALDSHQKLWVSGLGGVSILGGLSREQALTPEQGLPTVFGTCVQRAPDSTMWVGTEAGVVRYRPDGRRSLLFSRRWLLDDHVRDIAFDKAGNAWIATDKGVSAIRRQAMTLAQKADFFYDVLMKRHIREPWIAGQCRLPVAGDLTRWEPEDDDNDGEYTGNYLAMEAFRYAVTQRPDAREKAARAFRFLKLLQEVTGTDGFFARTIVPARWTTVHDGNRHYTDRQLADELVKEPRFKPVTVRWHQLADGKWLWKGDTSSDELCGHMMGYYFYYELVADEAEKRLVRQQVKRIADHLIAHDFNLVDVDGKPTRWAVWSPEQLNRHPEWAPDRHQNSMEILAFMKLAHHVTGEATYEQHYLRLIEKEGYLDNMARISEQNPAWFIYFDVMLSAYCYPILLGCEKDPRRLAFYQKHMDEWFERRRGDHNPLINFLYAYSRGKAEELNHSAEFFRDTPLDLIDWPIDHTKREDIRLVRKPVLDELQVSELPPPSIRLTIRWDKNPWTAAGGDPHKEREPVFWLLPYWMGRYLKLIQ
ncbi:ligand-binding sensor domain-containing protein [Tellurirhabdus rosea]|uniref:ligand-binding sensor domain-containing protein n=1 Tax=Tellurirhabdus rosea TaxID=2674997 RepID=UPI00225C0338|nr:regulator [Tellurirhabdus rosea]